MFIGRKYDYVFGYNIGALTDMVPAVVIRKIYNKPLMFWVQDIWPESIYAYGFKKTKILSSFLNIFVKFMFHNISAIAISGRGFKEKLSPYVRKNINFNYLPNWAINLTNNPEKFEFSSQRRVHFTFTGNIGKVQNLENIVLAFNLLSNKYKSKAQLNIIGNGSHLKHLIEISSKNSHIIF